VGLKVRGDILRSKLVASERKWDSSCGRLVPDHTEDLAVDAVLLSVEARVSDLSVFIASLK